MSVRLEWITAKDTYIGHYSKGEELGDGNTVVHDFAIGIGPMIIEGTADELRTLATRIMLATGADEPEEPSTTARLEYLRGELRAERISYGELVELQGLAEHIDPGDVELREAAGIPEGE
jgi:hypothetical protein